MMCANLAARAPFDAFPHHVQNFRHQLEAHNPRTTDHSDAPCASFVRFASSGHDGLDCAVCCTAARVRAEKRAKATREVRPLTMIELHRRDLKARGLLLTS